MLRNASFIDMIDAFIDMIDIDKCISQIIVLMKEFQEKNGIKEQCVTNAIYLYDCIKKLRVSNIEAKAVIVASLDDEKKLDAVVGGHIVLMVDDMMVLEPSYDVSKLENKTYFDNVKAFIDSFYGNKSRKFIKDTISAFCEFNKLAECINKNGIVNYNKILYKDQADYVRERLDFLDLCEI